MKEKLTFDDVLIVPQFSEISSRANVDLWTKVGHKQFSLPIISANMDTISGSTMSKAMISGGAQTCLHRFWSIEENVKAFQESIVDGLTPMVSIGLGDHEIERAEALKAAEMFVIDVANGAQQTVVDQVKKLRNIIGPYKSIVVGNFASPMALRTFLYKVNGDVEAVKIGIGPGCFAAGTRVLMADGTYKNIEDIKIHDRVINKDGKSVQVIGVKFSGNRKVIKYKNNLFYKDTVVTPDHRHWVGDYSTAKNIGDHSIVKFLSKPTKTDESKLRWKEIGDCSKAVLLLPKCINFELKESFNLNLDDFSLARRNLDGLTEMPKVTPSYELGYIFGTFLGDGHATICHSDRIIDGKVLKNTSGITSWAFGKNEMDIAIKLANSLKSVFNFNAKIEEKHNIINVLNRNNSLTRLLKEFNKRDKKHLPNKYFCSDKKYLQGLLDGLLDSDGHYGNDGRDGFSNTSSLLSEQFGIIFYLVNGYFPSVTFRKPSAGGLVGCNAENCKPSFISRSVTRPEFNQLENYQINRINDFEPMGIYLPTYDIEVDCDTHSFIANNAIVHNSMCSTRVKTGCGYPQLSALEECKREITMNDHIKDNIKIIADGGIRSPGDVAKALVYADAVMIGGMLAGTEETPGDLAYKTGTRIIKDDETLDPNCYPLDKPPTKFKKYRGSASKESYEAQGKTGTHRTAEGESTLVPYKGPVKDVLQDIEGGLRSALTYVGAANLKEFRERAEFIRITNAGYIEGTPHGKKD